MKLFIYLAMVFCHIIDDYCLQGILASMKQKKWWEKNLPITANPDMYKYDYLMALFMHSFSWSFMILLPVAIYQRFNIDWIYIILFIGNCIIHFIVDHMKANLNLINLVKDQFIHLIQITVSAIILL